MGVAAGNLWLVRLAIFILQPMEHTNHTFPAATATGVPCGAGRKSGMAEWRNGGIGGMAEWRNGGIAEWRNSGMAE